MLFGSAVPHFYHTSRRDPGASFELRRWAAILLPTSQIWQHKCFRAFQRIWFADTVSVSPTIADKPCDEWNVPLKITSQEIFFFPRNAAHDSCVYIKSNFLETWLWQVFLLECDLECLYTVLNNLLACVAFIFEIRLTFWQMSGAVKQPRLPTKELGEMGRLFLTKPIREV